MSACILASFGTLLAAQPCIHLPSLRNFATWHMNSGAKATVLSLYLPPHALSAPKGQPIQGGDRSKTMLLILGRNNSSHPNALKVRKGEEGKTHPGGMSVGSKDRGGGGEGCLYIF